MLMNYTAGMNSEPTNIDIQVQLLHNTFVIQRKWTAEQENWGSTSTRSCEEGLEVQVWVVVN